MWMNECRALSFDQHIEFQNIGSLYAPSLPPHLPRQHTIDTKKENENHQGQINSPTAKP